MGTALLIIDMQLGNFLEPHPVHEGDRLLKRVKNLIAKARSAQIPIFYVQNSGGEGVTQMNTVLLDGRCTPQSSLDQMIL